MTGTIFDIQRFSVHDGPGIRTTVFFKGCYAGCEWCHNPESFAVSPQLQYYPDRCIGCGKCVLICPNGAHNIVDGKPSPDREKCVDCGLCAKECFSGALVTAGRDMTVDEAIAPVLADRIYYSQSGGGVTLSGGEPVMQGDFCEELLKRLKAEGIHTTLQTAGMYYFYKLERLLPFVDLVMYDIKGFSREIYDTYVYGDSILVFDNLKRLDEFDIPIIVRTPCVSPVNDTPEEIGAIARMLSTLKNLKYYSLLPYHGLAKVKYDALGLPFTPFETPDKTKMELLKSVAAEYVAVE
jgi:pyruvate formate lyase activating enzyme